MVDNSEASRARLQYHLCQLFPEPVVVAIMEAHPNETNSQVLCERILAMRRGFQNTPQYVVLLFCISFPSLFFVPVKLLVLWFEKQLIRFKEVK